MRTASKSGTLGTFKVLKSLAFVICANLLSCGGASGETVSQGGGPGLPPPTDHEGDSVPPVPGDCSNIEVRINELMADNEGAALDQQAETEDWLELVNTGKEPVNLACLQLERNAKSAYVLPSIELAPQQHHVFWADNERQEGVDHLPYKLSSDGGNLRLRLREEVRLIDSDGVVDSLQFEAMGENEVMARFPDGGDWQRCRYASPKRANGDACAPPELPSIPDQHHFLPYQLDADFNPSSALVITEIDLSAGGFVELQNRGDDAIELESFTLNLSPIAPGDDWPSASDANVTGTNIELVGEQEDEQEHELEPGAFLSFPLSAQHLSVLTNPEQEGVLSLFTSEETLDRVDFMRWPAGAILARRADGLFEYCTNASPGEANDCDPLPSREVGDRVRYLRTPGDFAALGSGELELGIASVKAVVERKTGVVHLLSGKDWALHYSFVREQIYGEASLDRCDPVQEQEFDQGWWEFSEREYFVTEGREFLLATLSHHSAADLHALEYTYGDKIAPEQMREGFYSVLPHLLTPNGWSLRAQDEDQVEKARSIEGTLPIVGPNAPFQNQHFQALTDGEAYGVLKFVPSAQLFSEPLGPRVIVLTDDVPNDIPFVGGLITEAFQTPLAHVNVLSQNRGTPNAALRDARHDARITEHLDTLVHLKVSSSGIVVEPASAQEAEEFWERFEASGPRVSPRIDATLRGPQDLAAHGLSSIPAVGAKAAQMGELLQLAASGPLCGAVEFPAIAESPFALPVVHYLEHFEASGAKALLDELRGESDFISDPLVRAEGLARVRKLILEHPVDATLLSLVENEVDARFGQRRVRFRSSSNAEDLPNFNGAGLYTSISAELGDPSRSVEDALRVVWASTQNARAYDEREFANVEHDQVAMGVLVHPAFLSEEGNGVAVSRNVLDPLRGDIHYINAQRGEASVTNPAPGVSTEQLTNPVRSSYRGVEYQSYSSLLLEGEERVLTNLEIDAVSCGLRHIHNWFKQRLDPNDENRLFAMEIEFKLADQTRQLVVKQARPHPFAERGSFNDCREF